MHGKFASYRVTKLSRFLGHVANFGVKTTLKHPEDNINN